MPDPKRRAASDAVADARPSLRIESDPRYRAVVVGLLFMVAASLAYFALASRQADPDTFWHIATGRYILAHHSVPSTDVFSWFGIEHHLSWMPQSWLFGVLAYLGWLVGGFRLLYVATALAAATAAGLVYRLFAIRSGNRVLALAAAVLTAAGMLPSVAPRPQMLTYVLLLVLALLLEHRKWWWAVPVVVLAVNLHGPLYPMFLLVVAYYVLPARWPVLATCAAVVILTPAGLALVPYPFLSLLGGASPIQEFARVAPVSWPVYLIGLLLLFVLLDRRTIPAKDLMGLLALVVLSLVAARHMVFLFLLAVPLAAPWLELPSALRPRVRGTSDQVLPVAASGASRSDARATRGGRAMAVLDGVLIAVLVLGAAVPAALAIARPIDPTDGYPEQAARYLNAHGITRFFNEWGDGGFLILRGMPPLIDGRGDPFFPYPGRPGVTVGADYIRAWYVETDCRPFLAKNGITHLLIHESSPLCRVLEQSPAFRAVYRDAVYVVYERLSSAVSAH